MPQIPTVVAPEQVAIPRMSPQIAGEPGMALARTGEAITRTAEYGLQVEEHVRDAQNHLAALKGQNHINAVLNRFYETLKQSGDPNQLPDFEAVGEELKSYFGADPEYADPRVQRALGVHIDAAGETARDATVMRKLTLQYQQEEAQLNELEQTTAFKAAEAPDDQVRELAFAPYETAVRDAARHWLTPLMAEIRLRNVHKMAEDVEIRNALASYDPARLQAMIDKVRQHPEAFKEMNPSHFAELTRQLERELPIAKRMKQEGDDNAQAGILVTKYTNDPRFRDPETGKTNFDTAAAAASTDPDLSLSLQDKVSKELKYRAELSGKEDRDWNAEALAKYYTAANELQLSDQQIDELEQQWVASGRKAGVGIPAAVATQLKEIEARTLSQRRAERVEQKAEERAQHAAKIEEENRQSDLIAGQLSKRIQNFEYVSKSEIYSHVPALHWKAAQELVTMSEAFTVLPTDTKQALTSANKIIDNSIAPPKGLGIPSTPLDIKAADAAKMELSEWLTSQDKEVKAGKRPPLTTREIHEHAQEIIPHHMPTQTERLDALQRQVSPGQKGTPPKSGGTWDWLKSTAGFGTTAAPVPPKPGTIDGGYRFKGGDPADQRNWERI